MAPVKRFHWLQLRRIVTLLLLLLGAPSLAHAEDAKRKDLYRLRAGDQVSITVTPQTAYACGGAVLPDGMLYLKNVGTVRAAGMTLLDLEDKVREALAEKLVAPKISATITQFAPSTPPSQGAVTITGAVARGGVIQIEDGLRLYKALELAGGPVKGADLTRVGIRHKDLTKSSVDLSTPERISSPEDNRLLKDGDSIDVPSLPTRSVSIRGAVVRPGLMDLQGDFRLWKALDLAGGSTREADLSAVRVVHADLTQTVVDLSAPEKIADPERNVVLRESDSVEVPLLAVAPPKLQEEQVRIRGSVLNPGRYPYRPGMEVTDLIQAAGKVSPAADLTHIQVQHGDKVKTVDLEAQEKMGFQGKVILQPEDEVFIPEQENRVVLIGAVPKHGPAPLRPGQTIREFFTEGGPDIASAVNPAAANLTKVQVIRRGEKPMQVNLQNLILKPKGKEERDITLASGDVIFIPPRNEPRGNRGPLGFLSQLSPLSFLFGAF